MASGICYTQSGGTKKYDGIVVPSVAKGDKSYNPGYDNIKHDTSSVPGEDHYSFDDPSSYTLVEKGSSARDDCPLIIVTYYPVAPANPCYFNYKKKKLDTYINYYVTFSLSNGMLNCKCNSVTNIPGTNNGNVTLGIDIELSDGIGSTNNEHIYFSWVMKDGINSNKSCSRHYYSGSGFTTQSSWESDNGDGTKTHYTFYINHDSIPSRPNSKSL